MSSPQHSWAELVEQILEQKWKDIQCVLEVGPCPHGWNCATAAAKSRWAQVVTRGTRGVSHVDVPPECARNTEIVLLILMGVAWSFTDQLLLQRDVSDNNAKILTGRCRRWMCRFRKVQ